MIVLFDNQQRKYPAEEMESIAGPVLHEVWRRHRTRFRWYPETAQAGVTVYFAGRDRIRAVNRETRGVDRITDVLSFPLLALDPDVSHVPLRAGDIDRATLDEPVVWLGELVICPDVAAAQARRYGHGFRRELAFLAAHGMLHLLGYDHETPGAELVMRQRQEQVLSRLGYTRDTADLPPIQEGNQENER